MADKEGFKIDISVHLLRGHCKESSGIGCQPKMKNILSLNYQVNIIHETDHNMTNYKIKDSLDNYTKRVCNATYIL